MVAKKDLNKETIRFLEENGLDTKTIVYTHIYRQQLVDLGIATYEEVSIVTELLGFRKDVLDKLLYARTGLKTYEEMVIQYAICEAVKFQTEG